MNKTRIVNTIAFNTHQSQKKPPRDEKPCWAKPEVIIRLAYGD